MECDMRPGDNKWSITIWARDPETGQAKWAYQVLPHDAWDYDEIMENILIDMPWQGRIVNYCFILGEMASCS